uniref:Uncharacterized protein n=1 Tax=Arundo donax TaxID=35708 RepID=A0A0A9BFD5_ARUDO
MRFSAPQLPARRLPSSPRRAQPNRSVAFPAVCSHPAWILLA